MKGLREILMTESRKKKVTSVHKALRVNIKRGWYVHLEEMFTYRNLPQKTKFVPLYIAILSNRIYDVWYCTLVVL